MTYNAELYSEIEPRLNDWLQNTGGEVSNLALDLLNRGQRRLEGERRWNHLSVYTSLTVSGKSATLPSDMSKMIALGVDSDGDGKIDAGQYYFQEGSAAKGFKLVPGFTKAAGHSWTITFYTAPSGTVYLKYQKRLADFTGSGTEYSFFPGALLLRAAQLERCVDKAMDVSEVRIIQGDYDRLLKNYIQAHQYELAPEEIIQLDEVGAELSIEAVSLDGSDITTSRDHYSRSYDRR